MQATARRLSVVSATSCARRRLIRDVRPMFRVCYDLKDMTREIIDWANANDGFIGLFTAIVLPVVLLLFRSTLKSLSRNIGNAVDEAEIIRIERLRDEIHNRATYRNKETGYGDFLIRDVERDRSYPPELVSNPSSSKPPSSYQVLLVDFAPHGLRVLQGMAERIKQVVDESTWCLASDEDKDAYTAYIVSVIPYSGIVAINWHGDPVNPFPHIFCRFDGMRGWPYSKIEYCECRPLNDKFDIYLRLVDALDVTRRKF